MTEPKPFGQAGADLVQFLYIFVDVPQHLALEPVLAFAASQSSPELARSLARLWQLQLRDLQQMSLSIFRLDGLHSEDTWKWMRRMAP